MNYHKNHVFNIIFMSLVTLASRESVLYATLPQAAMNQWQLVQLIEDCNLGTIITQNDIPYTITQPGLYSLCEDITLTSNTAAAITIASSDVTLNLNNRSITSTNSSAITASVVSNIQILNGSLTTINHITIRLVSCTEVHISQIDVIEYPDVVIQFEGCGRCLLENCTFYLSNENIAPFVGRESSVVIRDFSFDIVVRDCLSINPAFSEGFYTSANSSGITFENCTVLGRLFQDVGRGFLLTGENSHLINCKVTGMRYGIDLGIGSHNIYCENCIIKDCFTSGINCGGFTNSSSTDYYVINNATIINTPVGIFLQKSVQSALISNCNISLCSQGIAHEGSSVLLKNINITNAVSGIVTNSNINAEDCSLTNASNAGFLIALGSISLKNSTATGCPIGFYAPLANTLGQIIIKDSLFTQNSRGISGSNLVILDTRSFFPLNASPDATPGSLVVIY